MNDKRITVRIDNNKLTFQTDQHIQKVKGWTNMYTQKNLPTESDVPFIGTNTAKMMTSIINDHRTTIHQVIVSDRELIVCIDENAGYQKIIEAVLERLHILLNDIQNERTIN